MALRGTNAHTDLLGSTMNSARKHVHNNYMQESDESLLNNVKNDLLFLTPCVTAVWYCDVFVNFMNGCPFNG